MKKYYPKVILVGSPFAAKELIERIAKEKRQLPVVIISGQKNARTNTLPSITMHGKKIILSDQPVKSLSTKFLK